jgi:hypothetical protein
VHFKFYSILFIFISVLGTSWVYAQRLQPWWPTGMLKCFNNDECGQLLCLHIKAFLIK